MSSRLKIDPSYIEKLKPDGSNLELWEREVMIRLMQLGFDKTYFQHDIAMADVDLVKVEGVTPTQAQKEAKEKREVEDQRIEDLEKSLSSRQQIDGFSLINSTISTTIKEAVRNVDIPETRLLWIAVHKEVHNNFLAQRNQAAVNLFRYTLQRNQKVNTFAENIVSKAREVDRLFHQPVICEPLMLAVLLVGVKESEHAQDFSMVTTLLEQMPSVTFEEARQRLATVEPNSSRDKGTDRKDKDPGHAKETLFYGNAKHSEGRHQTVVDNDDAKQYLPCFHWQYNGVCKYGDDCKYSHADKHKLSKTRKSNRTRKPTRPCSFCDGQHWDSDCPDNKKNEQAGLAVEHTQSVNKYDIVSNANTCVVIEQMDDKDEEREESDVPAQSGKRESQFLLSDWPGLDEVSDHKASKSCQL